MKVVAAGLLGVARVVLSKTSDQLRHASAVASAEPVHAAGPAAAPALTPAELTKVVQQYCVVCHHYQMLTGNHSLQSLQVENPVPRAETVEKMIVKLRAGMMPPPGAPRPGPDTLLQLVTTLEQAMDKAAASSPNPGTRVFQRLNRAEYTASIKALLDLDIDAGLYFPLDTKSANFDNIADVQMLSATMMDAYLRAADDISRLAVGVSDA